MTARDTTILHRPATDLVPESVLVGMEQNGWTPTQVRELIASYRELVRDVQELRGQAGRKRRAKTNGQP